MDNNNQPIIIKRVKKRHHEGHHGGAWKVAYADFITAMMALFLVLWLIAMLSVETKKAVAEYFRSYTIFKGEEVGGKGISPLKGGPVKLTPEPGDTIKRGIAFRDRLVNDLRTRIEERLYDIKDQILIFTTNEGVRIEMVDKEGSPMFELGRSNLLPQGERALHVISESLKGLPSSITIEGHTDSYQYPTKDYTNWELSADRANTARRELIKNGVDPKMIKRVAGFADTMPIKPENPYAPTNRRVSILVWAGDDGNKMIDLSALPATQ